MKLEHKVVLITGASGGLGEQIAYEAAKKGALVIACARRTQLLDKVVEKCQGYSGHPAYALEVDMSQPESIERLYQEVVQITGSVDILVNCAGFGLFENFADFDFQVVRKMFEVNVLGLMYLTQKMAILMAEAGHGQIINIASQAGKMATPKSTVYSATKFAVLGFSNALRLELKPLNIQVTTVNPGPIATNFFNIADRSGDYLSSVDWLVLNPQKLAQRITALMGTSKRELNAPILMEMANRCYTLFPQIGDFLAGSIFNKK